MTPRFPCRRGTGAFSFSLMAPSNARAAESPVATLGGTEVLAILEHRQLDPLHNEVGDLLPPGVANSACTMQAFVHAHLVRRLRVHYFSSIDSRNFIIIIVGCSDCKAQPMRNPSYVNLSDAFSTGLGSRGFCLSCCEECHGVSAPIAWMRAQDEVTVAAPSVVAKEPAAGSSWTAAHPRIPEIASPWECSPIELTCKSRRVNGWDLLADEVTRDVPLGPVITECDR